jgi:hypothetical protein
LSSSHKRQTKEKEKAKIFHNFTIFKKTLQKYDKQTNKQNVFDLFTPKTNWFYVKKMSSFSHKTNLE